jgi:DNA-binding GntR family transcriptional regulator
VNQQATAQIMPRSDSATRPIIGDAVSGAVELIRDQILSGALPAGTQLKQLQLAQELGVSHIPLREAFKILESEGFVICHARRGTFVADLTVENASEIWELRANLEPVAVSHSVPRITPKDIALARGLLEQAARTDDHITWRRLNWDFHRTLYSAAGRPMLLDMLDALWHNVDRYCTVLARANNGQHAICDHEDLLSAYSAGDVQRATTLVVSHMELVGQNVQKLLTGLRSASQ